MIREEKKLYYIARMVPTPHDLAEAEALGIAAFRNATVCGDTLDGLEQADVVAGFVPRGYWKMPGCKLAGRRALEAFAKAQKQAQARAKANAAKAEAQGKK